MSSPAFVNINSTFENYKEPVPFQQFRGNYATMAPTTAGGMFGTVTLPAVTPGVCRQLCASNLNCEMWTFDSSRRCNLYNSTDTSTITGIRVDRRLRSSPVTPFSIHSNTIPSRNLVQSPSPAPSLQACEQRCNVTSACALYTYSLTGTGTGTCSMYQFGTSGSGNVGSSKDLLIATPEVMITSVVLQNTLATAGTSAKTFRVTYSNSFTGALQYSIYDVKNPTQIMLSMTTNPTSPATSTFTGTPTLGNAYVVRIGTTISAPVYFYANASASNNNFTFDYDKYRCHVFHANGTLTINGTGTIEYFVVGGGGGGAGGTSAGRGGGGGGGQVVTGTNSLPPGGINSLTITVGTGGALGTTTTPSGSPGTASSISITGSSPFVTATGGRGGATNLGGTSGSGNSGSTSGGGGGQGGSSSSISGGAGFSSNFRNGGTTSTGYGGGGGGGTNGSSSGGTGTGGGGNGATISGTTTIVATAGTPNTGGGGGGGRGGSSATSSGGKGADGIVMIRYELK